MGFKAASLGTVGVVAPSGSRYMGSTTPDPVLLHQTLAELAGEGVSHLAIEASSHGLAQHRLDGMRLSAGAFTNLTRDHLDYHPTFEDYRDAKARLFSEVLQPGAAAVINADGAHADHMIAAARARGLTLFTVGEKGEDLRLVSCRREGLGQQLVIAGQGFERSVSLPLVGAFQASNALVAAGLVIATGGEPQLALWALESFKGAKGRLELVARAACGAPVFVDYAHTPDALENALAALRPYAEGRLSVVFGCGGDRDPGKRPQMGAVAARMADRAYVTDDNPRSEDPALIRAAVLAGCPGGIDAGDRHAAIARAVADLAAGDVLLIAGKGHETGQIIGKDEKPFSDHDEVLKAIGFAGGKP
jgi:UDP-N-acetylmuramoyl-L-alanyl-D-glutamate--2,6-diaminopimelate ligase